MNIAILLRKQKLIRRGMDSSKDVVAILYLDRLVGCVVSVVWEMVILQEEHSGSVIIVVGSLEYNDFAIGV